MKPVSIFISYSHKDEDFRKELGAHLRVLERLGIVASWHDRLISPGSDWSRVIDHHIDHANIILCLVSADFFNSEYCWEKEMKRALLRHSAKQAVVIPVLIRPVAWHQTPLAALQGLPRGMVPISDSSSRDAAWMTVVEGIMEVAQDIFGARQRVLNGLTAAEPTKDPNVVSPVIREALEFLRIEELYGVNEIAVEEVNWPDLTLLRTQAPVVAKAVEDCRRAQNQISVRTKKYLEAIQQSLLKSNIEIVLAVFTTLLAENERLKIVLKLQEAQTLVTFEDARESASPGVRSLLDPVRYGFKHPLPVLNEQITVMMENYAKVLEAAGSAVGLLKGILADVVKALGDKS